MVFRKTEENIFIAITSGCLILKHIYDDHGVEITEKICIGDRFHTPYSDLEKAKKERIVYTSNGLKNSN